jgi:aminoglycoside phosphotransferase family enzyme
VATDPLQSPDAWRAFGLQSRAVEVIETHCAWVYLAGGHVLKRKKPVTLWSNPLHVAGRSGSRPGPMLDFATEASRESACREEVRLNGRLAADVYVGVLALWDSPGGGAYGNSAKPDTTQGIQAPPGTRTVQIARDPQETCPEDRKAPADWLVWMRCLPRTRMLDHQLLSPVRTCRPDLAAIDRLGDRLARFWLDGVVDAPTAAAHQRAVDAEHEADAAMLTHPRVGLRREALPALRQMDRLRSSLDGALRERVACGALRDGHGDLRPEHIAMLEPPRIIDALEFDAALRTQDPFEELAFLGLECERMGAVWIGPRLMARWTDLSGDVEPTALMPLYTARRALLRARLALAHLLETPVRQAARWRPLAQWYLGRAAQALKA